MSAVVQLCDYLEPKQKSFFELYPMPFFDRTTGNGWNVTATGDYGKDCETGRAYAIEFLRSCDGTVGWSILLTEITAHMIAGGCTKWPDGAPRTNGIVVGFMSTIGKYLATH
jgi:hypothetical protein